MSLSHPATQAWLTAGQVAADLRELTRRKREQEVEKLKISNEERRGGLISRELVRTSIFGSLENMNQRLLTDAPRTITGRLFALAKSGATQEEGERVVREIVSSHLRLAKESAIRVLRGEPEPEPKPGDAMI